MRRVKRGVVLFVYIYGLNGGIEMLWEDKSINCPTRSSHDDKEQRWLVYPIMVRHVCDTQITTVRKLRNLCVRPMRAPTEQLPIDLFETRPKRWLEVSHGQD